MTPTPLAIDRYRLRNGRSVTVWASTAWLCTRDTAPAVCPHTAAHSDGVQLDLFGAT